jgi:ribosomal-protein-alanine N-acetyltransferase
MSLLRRISSAHLGGKKVTLRPVDPADAERAFGLLHGREEILRWLLWRGPESVPELQRAFAPWSLLPGPYPDYVFAIVDRKSGLFSGTTGLRFGGQAGGADIGYWLDQALWGRGMGSEAIQLCCAFVFRHLGAPSVSAWAFLGNEGSKTALERNGFSLMRTVMQKIESDGKAYDQWNFVLLREEWMEQNVGWTPEIERIEFVD